MLGLMSQELIDNTLDILADLVDRRVSYARTRGKLQNLRFSVWECVNTYANRET